VGGSQGIVDGSLLTRSCRMGTAAVMDVVPRKYIEVWLRLGVSQAGGPYPVSNHMSPVYYISYSIIGSTRLHSPLTASHMQNKLAGDWLLLCSTCFHVLNSIFTCAGSDPTAVCYFTSCCGPVQKLWFFRTFGWTWLSNYLLTVSPIYVYLPLLEIDLFHFWALSSVTIKLKPTPSRDLVL